MIVPPETGQTKVKIDIGAPFAGERGSNFPVAVRAVSQGIQS